MRGGGFVHRGDAGSEVVIADDCVVKRHRSRGAWQREVRAYRELRRLCLEGSGAIRVPRLLSADEVAVGGGVREPGAMRHFRLVMERVPGSVLTSRELDRYDWCLLGRALGALHAATPRLEPPSDPLGVRAALERRLAPPRAFFEASDGSEGAACAREGGARLARLLEAQLIPELGDHGERVFCHRDFRPRNVLWLPSAQDGGTRKAPALVDFEHARWDFAAADFARLPMCWPSQWPEGSRCSRVRAWGAFVAGYSDFAELPAPEELIAFRGMHALATLMWGLKHRSHGRYSEGRGLVGDWLADYQRPT